MALPHMATFPGLFSSNGLLGAGPQTSAWLNVFRQGGFPVIVIGYALLKGYDAKTTDSRSNSPASAVPTAVGTVAAVCLLTLLATSDHQLLPPIVDGDGYATTMMAVSVALCVFSLVALAILESTFCFQT